MNPGSTSATRVWLTHGWSGTVCGSQSTTTVVQAKIPSGSPQALATPSSPPHCSRARTHRRASRAIPNPPSSRAGMPMYQMTQYRLSSAYERVGSTGSPSSFCSAPTYPAVPGPGFQCAVWTDGRIRKAISTAATSPAATSGARHRSAPRAARRTQARAGGQAVTATAATVTTATASATRPGLAGPRIRGRTARRARRPH